MSQPPIDDVIDAILAASRALVAVSARSIAGAKNVTLPQYRMLVVLDEAPTNLTGLARALDVAPSTAMRMVDRLEAAELVRRVVSTTNRRETQLRLTPAGRRVIRTVTAKRRRDIAAIVHHIPLDQHSQIADALAAFAAAAGQVRG